MKEKRGITLIALVVTIVVLLILASVSISMLTGENGIITQAQKSTIKNDNGTVLEGIRLKLSQYLSENEGTYKYDKLQLLANDYIIDENGVVNVEKLLEQRLKTGNGTDNKDVYVIEENHLYYYDNNRQKDDLGDLGDLGSLLAETDPSLFVVSDDGTISVKNKSSYYVYGEGYYFPTNYVKIPSEIDGIKIKYIAHDFFLNMKNIETVIIPKGVIAIGSGAFEGCSNLSSITIPEDLIAIGSYAFEFCSNLTSITIPSTVTNIENSVFSGCRKLMNVTIPNSITSIEDYAFSGCTELTSITIPKSVMSIGNSVFSGCSKLTNIIVDEENEIYDSRNECNAIIVTRDNTLISGCKSTIIPNDIVTIGNYAFSCTGLISIIIPNSVTSIGGNAFEYCTELTNIELSNNITEINSGTFSGCKSLKNIVIPNSITDIKGYSFASSGITSIVIPASVTSIECGAFMACYNLEEVNYIGSKEEWEAISIDYKWGYNQELSTANKNYNYTI